MNALEELAVACHNGACNVTALINSLPEAVKCIEPGKVKESVELKIIIGQISFLIGESLGPTSEAIQEFTKKLET